MSRNLSELEVVGQACVHLIQRHGIDFSPIATVIINELEETLTSAKKLHPTLSEEIETKFGVNVFKLTIGAQSLLWDFMNGHPVDFPYELDEDDLYENTDQWIDMLNEFVADERYSSN